MDNNTDEKTPFKVKDVTRNIKKAVCAATLEEIRTKVAEKFEKHEQLPTIHLDSDGTEIDDEEYFRTLDENTELIAVFPGEHWIDPTHYVTITSHRNENGTTDTTDAAQETARIKQLVGQLQNNLCNVSVMNDADLDSLSNMDPNSLVDITGKEFMEQLKDSGRPLCAKRNAEDRINLLKLLKAGAIFCSERYPEDAEAIDMEISRQMNINSMKQSKSANSNSITTTPMDNDVITSNINTPTSGNHKVATAIIKTQISNTKTIEVVQDSQANITETLVSEILNTVDINQQGANSADTVTVSSNTDV